MQNKLTLRLDNNLIEQAKKHAAEMGKSVSQLVADYFSLVGKKPTTKDDDLPPITRSLKGSLKKSRVDMRDYHQYLESKYR